MATLDFILDRLPELWLRTGEHVMLTGMSTGAAILIGIPLGIVASRMASLRACVLSTVGILQTIPSLAMLALLLALLGKIGAVPAVVALILYALLPIVRNTVAGLEGVSPEVMEAAQGIGMTDQQRLRIVQLPLARPVIVAGIRTAAVVGVGIATLSAFIGAGGLGQFINEGLALRNTGLILLGAIPSAVLALLVDWSIGAAEWGLRPTRQAERGTFAAKLKPAAVSLPLAVVALGVAGYFVASGGPSGQATAGTVGIASKNFTEQLILGELMGQLIEARTDLGVERRFNLGGTMICHEALVNDEVDMYAEYTGTSLTAILEHDVVTEPEEALRIVREAYRERFGVEWLEPFGFNNTYALTVRGDDAQRHGWQKISDLASTASELRAGFTFEFSERPDGYPGVRDAYGFSFGEMRGLEPALMYEAIAKGQVDVICAFATDGRIAAFNLKPLEDDKAFFPPYYAAPIVRAEALRQHPELREALAPLAGALDDATMQRLNYEVDEEKGAPADVAREFLVSHDLLLGGE